MLPLPFRPLVPLSALALLGWCWYTFRKKRNLCESVRDELVVSSAARKQSITESLSIQEVVASGSTLAAQDMKTYFQSQDKQEGDPNLDHNCSQPRSTMDESSVLSGASQAPLTSTPIVQLQKGIRLEPEGEVSEAQASLLLAEKPETEMNKEDDDIKGHSNIKAINMESFAQQPTGIVCSKEHGVANMSEKQNERVPSLSEVDGLVVEVISGVTEEITATGGILKRKGHMEPRVTLQNFEVDNMLAVTKKDIGALTKAVEETVSPAHKLNDPPTTFPAWEDSGCSTWHSEDGVEVEKASGNSQSAEKTSSTVSLSSESHQAVAPKKGKLSRQKADASKG